MHFKGIWFYRLATQYQWIPFYVNKVDFWRRTESYPKPSGNFFKAHSMQQTIHVQASKGELRICLANIYRAKDKQHAAIQIGLNHCEGNEWRQVFENLPNLAYGAKSGSSKWESVEKLWFALRSQTYSSDRLNPSCGSGNTWDKGVVAQGNPLDLSCFGRECFLPKVLIPFQHFQLYCQLQYGSELRTGKTDEALVSSLWQERRRDVCLCKHINSLMLGHIARLEDFSSLACTAWQTGSLFSPYRRQYHSSDMSPFACLMCESKTCCAY